MVHNSVAPTSLCVRDTMSLDSGRTLIQMNYTTSRWDFIHDTHIKVCLVTTLKSFPETYERTETFKIRDSVLDYCVHRKHLTLHSSTCCRSTFIIHLAFFLQTSELAQIKTMHKHFVCLCILLLFTQTHLFVKKKMFLQQVDECNVRCFRYPILFYIL